MADHQRAGSSADEEAPEGDAPLSAGDAYELIATERLEARRRRVGIPSIFYLTWGLVWLVSHGVVFLADGPAGTPLVPMPGFVPGVVQGVLVGAGIVISIVVGSRSSGRIAGVSAERGVMYGLAWFVAFTTLSALGARITPDLPSGESWLLWSALSTGVVGTLYVAGAAIWRDRAMFVLGIWVSVSNIAGIVAGPGWHALVVSLAGGGGLLTAGVLLRLSVGRAPKP